MIICGYAGIGKSYLGHNFPNVIDLESTPFEKDWDRYFKCAVHYHNQGYLVLISCHKEIREMVCHFLSGVPYDQRMTVVPCVGDKALYRERYAARGSSKEFIDVQMKNWERWLDERGNRMMNEHWVVLESGETLYDGIVRMSSWPPSMFCDYDECPMGECTQMAGRCVNPLRKYADKFLELTSRR